MKKWKKPFVSAMMAMVLIASVTACNSGGSNGGGADSKKEEVGGNPETGQKTGKLRLLGLT